MPEQKNTKQLRQMMEKAKELIQHKEYDKARQILERIDTQVDNPTVKKWLAKLDEIAPKDNLFGDMDFPKSDNKPKQKKGCLQRGIEISVWGIIALCGLAFLSTLMGTPSPANTSVPNNTRDAIEIESNIRGITSINPSSVEITDGRANGGERGVIISYVSRASDEAGLASEWGELFGAVGATVRENDIDLDAMLIVVGDSSGAAVGSVAVQIDDVIAFLDGRITVEVFWQRLVIVDF